MSFARWKRSYLRNKLCETNSALSYWLVLRGEKMIPELENQAWVCKEEEQELYMIQYHLELSITDLKKKYSLDIQSLLSSDEMIQEEYFKIFGNLCKILSKTIRIMEYPHGKIHIQKYSIYAEVKSLWKEERSANKINRFFKNCYKKQLPALERIRAYKKSDVRDIFAEKPVHAAGTHNIDASWSSDHYHKKIVRYFTQDKPKNIKKPRLVLIFGLPGSGKNWVLEKKRNKGHVMINVDDCRALLPNYWKNMSEKSNPGGEDWIRLFHDECNVIAFDIFKYAINTRMNIVWNGTGKNQQKYSKLITESKKRGYVVELRYVWVPLAVAKARVHRRASIIGRNVPDEIIKIAKKKIPVAFQNLTVDADYARVFCNTLNSPTMIWDRDQGWDGTPRRRKSINEDIFAGGNPPDPPAAQIPRRGVRGSPPRYAVLSR